MGNFLGFLIVAAILLPNLIFLLCPPQDKPNKPPKEPIVLTIIENIGRYSCFILPIIFGKDLLNKPINLFCVGMIFCILLNIASWIRYLKHKSYLRLFEPICKIPAPLAVFPSLYFVLFAFWISSVVMGLAAVVFSVGHITISIMAYNKLNIHPPS